MFGGAYFRRGLLSEGILHFKMGWTWQYQDNNLKQIKTANSNSPWAYIREGLFFGGLIIGILRIFSESLLNIDSI